MRASKGRFTAWMVACGITVAFLAAAGWSLAQRARRLRIPLLEGPTAILPIPVAEPSGIAYHPSRRTILVVSDEGCLAELDTHGRELDRFEVSGDLEGLAVHPQTGTVFIAQEGRQAILEYDLDLRRVIRSLRLDLRDTPGFNPKKAFNKGLEGICVVEEPSGSYQLWIAWERRPARIARLDADISVGSSERARQAVLAGADPVQHAVRVASSFAVGLRQLSDLCYDPESELLIVLSARDRTLTTCSSTGQATRSFRLEVSKPEGICLLPNGDGMIAQEDTNDICIYRGLGQILLSHRKNPS